MVRYRDIAPLEAQKNVRPWEIKTSKKRKWGTLIHNGVQFAPSYEPLPVGVAIRYQGRPIPLDATSINNTLRVTAEEAAYFFAQQIERDQRLKGQKKSGHTPSEDAKFRSNFFQDWRKILGPQHAIKSLDDVDFQPLVNYIAVQSDAKRAARRALSRDERTELKVQKKEQTDLYGYALVDGMRIRVGNYLIQPPGLYQGHGQHPLRGRIKKRILPQDVTINVTASQAPRCHYHGNACRWKEIVTKHDATWLASWKHPITKSPEYVWMSRIESHWVYQEDRAKFDKARKLKKRITSIRKKYTRQLKSKQPQERMMATAVYLLDKLAIRPGTEKDEEKEAGTLGLTTLKCRNIKLLKNNRIKVNFTGKSSIEYVKILKILPEAYLNLRTRCSQDPNKVLFNFSATALNTYLKTLMPGLSAKVFRTWKASSLLQAELNNARVKVSSPDHDKRVAYEKVNLQVAKVLNHKRMTNNQERIVKLEQQLVEAQEKLTAARTDKQKISAQKKIALTKTKLEEARHNLSTSTSKVNYLDPRITVAWAKKTQTPIEQLYNKSQLRKFIWSMTTKQDWEF